MLSIKHLNTDASFLLTFESLRPGARPCHVLLDPWIVGSSKIFHSKISLTKHVEPACVTSLRQLPEPDLVIISQSKSDHCNEATLKQIPPSSATIILAEPAAARVIQSWKHFDREKVRTLKRWDENQVRRGGNKARNAVTRIPIPPSVPGGDPGEVTVAFIPQRRDLTGLHAAIGITFRSSPSSRKGSGWTTAQPPKPCVVPPPPPPAVAFPITPPATPKSHRSHPNLPTLYAASNRSPAPAPAPVPTPARLIGGRDFAATEEAPATAPLFTPLSPTSTIRSVRSCSTLTPTNTISSTLSAATTLPTTPTMTHDINTIVPPPQTERTLSVLFSPHGIPFAGNLESYATTHLVNEAALPLTALLHCFDQVQNPWWLGGNMLLGAPAGRDIAVRLGARCWVSCHDGDKDIRGLATGWVKTRRWDRETLERAVTGEGRDVVDAFGDSSGREKTRKPTVHPPGEKLELRRVGSKLRLWPSPPPKDLDQNNNDADNDAEKENKPKGRQIATLQPQVGVPGVADLVASSSSSTLPPPAAAAPAAPTRASSFPSQKWNNQGTQVIDLASGEMVVLTSEGPCNLFQGHVVPL